MISNPNTRIVRKPDTQGRALIVGVDSPVKGSGLRQWSLSTESPADLALLKAAIPVINGASNGDRLPADVRARLIELGILVHRRQVSAPSRLRCDLEALPGVAIDPDALVLAAGVRFEPTGGVPRLRADPLFVDGLDLDGPTAWVEDPATRVGFPYRVPARWTRALARLLDGQPIARVPAAARTAFHAAGILVSGDDLRAQQRRAAALAGELRTQMATQQATAPFDLGIPRLQLRALQRHYRALAAEGWFGPSTQAPGRVVIHNEAASSFLHRQLGPVVTALMGSPWRPSYCYLARYHAGADLAPHIDRPQCGFSISLQVELSPTRDRRHGWPLTIELPPAGDRPRLLEARMLDGEGVAFQGTQLRHWRDPLPAGREGTYLFLHFVDASFEGVLH
ncbi:MAG: hypothetical protein K8W52_08290 [Deltaproteobacteria bacterium]|nr:hypothetical protein [Deltaproteobacteria bacterium]